MAPDITSNDEDDITNDPDSHPKSFWNRIAASQLSSKPGHDKSSRLAKGGNPVPPQHRRSISSFKSAPRPASSQHPHKQAAPGLKAPTHPDSTGHNKQRDSTVTTRATSAGRTSSARPQPSHPQISRRSAPDMRTSAARNGTEHNELPPIDLSKLTLDDRLAKPNAVLPDVAPPLLSPRSSLDDERLSRHSSHESNALDDPEFWQELESRWILNLSMAFRDNSEREKFFITYAEEPNRWRRVTVSIDYHDKPPDSLEADLKTLPFQRDKSAHIYEAIHDSLPSVQFFDTVTNLRLETSDGRLHVHVTKDENEIIKYPSVDAIAHLRLGFQHEVLESDIHFQSHLSGFVYRVSVNGKSYIKKEIPGPDMIDEFLYEVNALWDSRDSPHVIDFCAIVLDDDRTCIKGLLISYADRGTLVDIIYDNRDPPLPWARRDKWAQQIVHGLADIHEHGFVQGDFTLSNIVIDSDDNARIIDINRRGCPVGWEPPEFQGLIGSGQRISMYIGTKSDLFQLGMVLWALAELDDEPERAVQALSLENTQSGAPSYLVDWVTSCLEDEPKDRISAKAMLAQLSTMTSTSPSKASRTPAANTKHSFSNGHSSRNLDQGSGPANSNPRSMTQPASDHEIGHQEGGIVTTTHAHNVHTLHREGPTVAKYQTPFTPLQHHDSGLPEAEYEIPRYRPPLHQDSGIDDTFWPEAANDFEDGKIDASHQSRKQNDFAMVGGQFG